MTDRFQGDPYLIMTNDGVELLFKSGQPVMDQGFENQVNISLLTKEGWFGNKLIANKNNQIGSDFLKIANSPITLTTIFDLEKSAINALASEVFGSVESSVSNPSGQRLNITNLITPVGKTSQVLAASRSFGNWLSQAIDPANEKV